SMNNIQNLKVRRLYLRWLKEAKGCSEETVTSTGRSIEVFDEKILHKDYRKIIDDDIILFKEKLKQLNDNQLSLNTIRTHLLNLRKFMHWLSSQKGYKNSITYSLIEYFNPSNQDTMIAKYAFQKRAYPDISYVIKLCDSIKIRNELDMRDK